jgi:hypothetical protein
MLQKPRARRAWFLAWVSFGVALGGSPVLAAAASAASSPAPATTAAVRVAEIGAAGSGVASQSRAAELAGTGYEEHEYFLSGEAQRYSGSSAGPATPTGEPQPYTTRILVRAPASSADFSGRVVVEPFNTSGAGDRDAAWGMIGSRIVENGDGWIGVTVRNSSVSALTTTDAVRYAPMDIASNGLAWDMLTQLARLARFSRDQNPLPRPVERAYMTGYSQSAVDAVTYANAFNPRAKGSRGEHLYDGYLLMGRSASATPLDSGTDVLPKLEFRPVGKGTSPIIDVESQSDVQGFTTPAYTNPGSASVRRADTDAPRDKYRLYEVPGSAHALRIPSCDHQGTTFPLRYVERAALENLYAWAEEGRAPPRARRITTTSVGTVSTFALDDNGNALGGVRSPFLDVALARYEGSDTPGPLCGLAGVETPLDGATLSARYAGVDDYMRQFTANLDHAIRARFFLRADRTRILDETQTKAEQAFAAAP